MQMPRSRAPRLSWTLLVLAATLTSSGCAATAPSPCSLFAWIEIPEADEPTVSAELVEQVRAHNQAWLEACEP